MRNPEERTLALECLRLADGNVTHAEQLLAFVLGADTDDAKAKLAIVREAVALKG